MGKPFGENAVACPPPWGGLPPPHQGPAAGPFNRRRRPHGVCAPGARSSPGWSGAASRGDSRRRRAPAENRAGSAIFRRPWPGPAWRTPGRGVPVEAQPETEARGPLRTPRAVAPRPGASQRATRRTAETGVSPGRLPCLVAVGGVAPRSAGDALRGRPAGRKVAALWPRCFSVLSPGEARLPRLSLRAEAPASGDCLRGQPLPARVREPPESRAAGSRASWVVRSGRAATMNAAYAAARPRGGVMDTDCLMHRDPAAKRWPPRSSPARPAAGID